MIGLERRCLPQFVCAWALVAVLLPCSPRAAAADPPFGGTIFIDPDIVTAQDATAFTGLTSTGHGIRTMYDRRSGWVQLDAYLFEASFSDYPGRTVEIQVNPEVGSQAAARVYAERYAPAIGQLPTALRRDLDTVWIHLGLNPFGGGNRNLLIHVGQADQYTASGILEETLVHEASHTSLDQYHGNAPGWRSAQSADPEFISTYARDNPDREDVAETFLTWLAVRHRADRISADLLQTISAAVPNRLAYFDGLGLDLFPLTSSGTRVEPAPDVPAEGMWLDVPHPNPFSDQTSVQVRLGRSGPVRLLVVDLLGRTVATLVDDSLDVGTHRFTWNGRNDDGRLPANAVYLLRLEFDGVISSRRVVLAR